MQIKVLDIKPQIDMALLIGRNSYEWHSYTDKRFCPTKITTIYMPN